MDKKQKKQLAKEEDEKKGRKKKNYEEAAEKEISSFCQHHWLTLCSPHSHLLLPKQGKGNFCKHSAWQPSCSHTAPIKNTPEENKKKGPETTILTL